MVDVLVFIGKHRVKAARPSRQVVRIAAHRAHRPEQQVAEIRGVGVAQGALIGDVDPGAEAEVARIDRLTRAVRFGDPQLYVGRRLIGQDQIVL